MSADIKVTYTLMSKGGHKSPGQTSEIRLTDWYSFADWLKENEVNGRDVVIHSWVYTHAIKR